MFGWFDSGKTFREKCVARDRDDALARFDRMKRDYARRNAMFNEHQESWRKAVEEHGHFFWMGRKVLLTFEDTGKPTNEDRNA